MRWDGRLFTSYLIFFLDQLFLLVIGRLISLPFISRARARAAVGRGGPGPARYKGVSEHENLVLDVGTANVENLLGEAGDLLGDREGAFFCFLARC